MIYYLVILSSLVFIFGEKIEQASDKVVGEVYDSHCDSNPSRTHLALYIMPYLTGALAFFCFASLVEALNDSGVYRLAMGAVLAFGLVVFYKITKKFYAISKAREVALNTYLSEG
jgi:hypothetical protein